MFVDGIAMYWRSVRQDIVITRCGIPRIVKPNLNRKRL
jgi:hypothetical protein